MKNVFKTNAICTGVHPQTKATIKVATARPMNNGVRFQFIHAMKELGIFDTANEYRVLTNMGLELGKDLTLKIGS